MSFQASEQIRQTFEFFDKDGSGTVKMSELEQGLLDLGFGDRERAEVRSLLLPVCQNSEVSLTTFTELMNKHLSRDPTDEATAAFRLFDEDGDGYITIADLEKISWQMQYPCAAYNRDNVTEDESLLKNLVEVVDLDRDGRISLADWLSFHATLRCTGH